MSRDVDEPLVWRRRWRVYDYVLLGSIIVFLAAGAVQVVWTWDEFSAGPAVASNSVRSD